VTPTGDGLGGFASTTFFVAWSATSTIPNLETTAAKIRVTLDDGNAINNIAAAESAEFIIDTTPPAIPLGNFILDSSTGGVGAGTITFTITDATSTQYRLCNDNTFPTTDAEGNSCAWSELGTNASTTILDWALIGAPSTETVYFQARDVYGLVTALTRVAPAALENYIFSDVTNVNTPSYRVYLDWTNSNNLDFASYQVFHATTTVGAPAPVPDAYVQIASVTGRTTSFYTHTIPSSDKDARQYYKVRMTLISGGISDFTNSVNDVPNGIGGNGAGGGVTTLSTGNDPAAATIAPGAGATDVNVFTLVKDFDGDTVTSVVVTLATSTGVGTLAITDALNNVLGSTTAVTAGANTIAVSGMSIGTVVTPFKIRVTPLTHTLMPAVPGASYPITAYVTSWLDNATTRTGSDTNTNPLTIDNTSPANVTATTTTAGSGLINLSWTNPVENDLHSVVVLRQASVLVTAIPTEGVTYVVGDTIGAATVACVVNSPTSGCTDQGLVND